MHLDKVSLASLALRLGLAYVFIFASSVAYLNPSVDYKYIPSFISSIVDRNLFLMLFGGFEVLLAVWLIIGRWTFYAALISAALLFGLTMLNLGELVTTFRNAAIICGALALAALNSDSNY